MEQPVHGHTIKEFSFQNKQYVVISDTQGSFIFTGLTSQYRQQMINIVLMVLITGDTFLYFRAIIKVLVVLGEIAVSISAGTLYIDLVTVVRIDG